MGSLLSVQLLTVLYAVCVDWSVCMHTNQTANVHIFNLKFTFGYWSVHSLSLSLCRHQRFEKAFLLAVDLEDRDLFMVSGDDAHFDKRLDNITLKHSTRILWCNEHNIYQESVEAKHCKRRQAVVVCGINTEHKSSSLPCLFKTKGQIKHVRTRFAFQYHG